MYMYVFVQSNLEENIEELLKIYYKTKIYILNHA